MHPVTALFERHAWATGELLRHCAGLDPALLDRDLPGTRGSIRTTLTHLVGTEQVQLALLTGAPAADPIRRGERRGPEALVPLAEASAARWRSFLAGPPDPNRLTWHDLDGARRGVTDWVVLVQCVHHGDEHRAHVASVLGAAGLEPPRLDGWAFRARGAAETAVTAAPGPWADALLRRFVGYSGWATGVMLDHCLGLGEPALRASAAGTYGTLHETLTHLIDTDGSYLGWLTGAPPMLLEGAADPALLRDCAERWRAGWLAAMEGAPDHERPIEAEGGRRAPAWPLVLQALHHANDHRAHVGTILGANGLPVPAVDAWAYGEAEGASPAA